MKNKIHIGIYIILSILVIVPVIGLYIKVQENKQLKDENANLSLDVDNLQETIAESLKAAQRQIDSTNNENVKLADQKRLLEQQVTILENHEKTVIFKYNSLYEKIKATDDFTAQLSILQELLARNAELAESEAD